LDPKARKWQENGEDCIIRSFITCTLHPGRDEKCIQNFVGKPEGKRALERPRRRWEDNIRMSIMEIG
jgi:hypothetical protein